MLPKDHAGKAHECNLPRIQQKIQARQAIQKNHKDQIREEMRTAKDKASTKRTQCRCTPKLRANEKIADHVHWQLPKQPPCKHKCLPTLTVEKLTNPEWGCHKLMRQSRFQQAGRKDRFRRSAVRVAPCIIQRILHATSSEPRTRRNRARSTCSKLRMSRLRRLAV